MAPASWRFTFSLSLGKSHVLFFSFQIAHGWDVNFEIDGRTGKKTPKLS